MPDPINYNWFKLWASPTKEKKIKNMRLGTGHCVGLDTKCRVPQLVPNLNYLCPWFSAGTSTHTSGPTFLKGQATGVKPLPATAPHSSKKLWVDAQCFCNNYGCCFVCKLDGQRHCFFATLFLPNYDLQESHSRRSDIKHWSSCLSLPY